MRKLLFIICIALGVCYAKPTYGQDPCHVPTVTGSSTSAYGDSAYAQFLVYEDPLWNHTFTYRVYNGPTLVGFYYSMNDTLDIPELDTNTTYTLKVVNTCFLEVSLTTFTTPDASFNMEETWDPTGRFADNPCDKPNALSTSVAFYGTQAWTHIEIDTPTATNYLFNLYLDTVLVDDSIQATDCHIVLGGLSQNSLYTLTVINTCSNEIEFTPINTTLEWDTAALMLSGKMFSYISEWAADTAQDSSWYDYIMALPDVHIIEKVSVLQHWWHHDTLPFALTLDPNPVNRYIPSSNDVIPYAPGGATLSSATCTCTYILRAGLEIPNLQNDPNYLIGGSNPTVIKNSRDVEGTITAALWNNDDNFGWGRSNGYKRKAYTRAGATKYMQLMAQRFETAQADEAWVEGTTVNGGGVSSYVHLIRMNYICVNQTLPTRECCDRTVNMQWNYSTSVEADSKTNRCVGCDKNAASSTEDMAFAGVLDVTTNTLSIVDAGQVLVSSKDNSSYNPQFGIAVVEALAKTAVATVAIVAAVDVPLIIASSASALEAILDIPSATKGSSSNETFSGTLTSGALNVTLKANEPKVFILSSHSKLYVSGKKSWWARARIESGSYLSVRHNGGVGDADYCCAPVVGAWIISSNSGAPLSNSSYKTSVKNHMNDWPDWGPSPNILLPSIDYDWGIKAGNFNPTCSTAVAIGKTAPAVNENSSPIGKTDNNGIFIQLPSENDKSGIKTQSCKYELYDITGRLLKKGEISESGRICELNDATAVYLLKMELNGTITSQKIAVIK